MSLQNSIGADGAQYLSELRKCPTLTSLNLSLVCNNISNAGTHNLALFREAPDLRHLNLELECNNISAESVAALATLQLTHTLKSLSLNLRNNAMDAQAAYHLSLPTPTASLDTVAFNFEGGNLGVRGVEFLSSFRAVLGLRTVALNLSRNQIGAQPPLSCACFAAFEAESQIGASALHLDRRSLRAFYKRRSHAVSPTDNAFLQPPLHCCRFCPCSFATTAAASAAAKLAVAAACVASVAASADRVAGASVFLVLSLLRRRCCPCPGSAVSVAVTPMRAVSHGKVVERHLSPGPPPLAAGASTCTVFIPTQRVFS